MRPKKWKHASAIASDEFCQFIFERCYEPQGLEETNLNVQLSSNDFHVLTW